MILPSKKIKDITGNKYNNLTAIEFSHIKNNFGGGKMKKIATIIFYIFAGIGIIDMIFQAVSSGNIKLIRIILSIF